MTDSLTVAALINTALINAALNPISCEKSGLRGDSAACDLASLCVIIG